jgi:signal transduction histidine kinase
LLLSAAIVVITGVEFARAAGRARRWRRTALVAAMFVALPIAAAAAATLARPGGGLARPTLAIYEVGLCAAAVLLVRGLRVSGDERVVDLVVELGETPSATLRDRLARALGDPTLALGYWSPRDRCYLEERGGRLAPAGLDPTRTTTPIDRDGERFAVLIHDAAVLRDPALVEAVAAATRLTNSNAALRAEVHEQVHELVTSRRHLLVIADRERRELEQRLRNGPERRLVTLARSLDSLPIAGTDTEHVVLARAQLTRTLDDLAALARGLHPRALADNGLDGALQTIAALSPVPVDLDVRVGRLSQAVETTVYFACAEALANVAKYAAASRASIEVAAADERLAVTIADDGRGGADPALGTGLRGLVDRFETLGGSLRVDSPKGGGTRLTAEVPLDASAPHA